MTYDQQSPIDDPTKPKTTAPTIAPTAPTADPNDPFAAMGGGVQINGGWVPKNHPLAQQAGTTTTGTTTGPNIAPGATPTGAQQALTGQTTVGATPAQGSQTSVASAFQQALVNRLAPGPVSENSAEIAPSIAANRHAEQRGFERNRAMLAERAAAEGVDPTAFRSQLTGLSSERSGREGAYAANAVSGLAQQRAQELTAALALGGNMLSEVDRQNLSRELAQLQAQISRESLASQSALGNRELEIRNALGMGNLNLGLLGTLLQNQQFGQNLGANLGMFNANLNQNSLASVLGGF